MDNPENQEGSSMDVQDESSPEESEFPEGYIDPRIKQFLRATLGKDVDDDEANSEGEPLDNDDGEVDEDPENDNMEDTMDGDDLGNSESISGTPRNMEIYRIRMCELEQDIGYLKQSISSVYDVFRCFNDLVLDIDTNSVPDLVYFLEKLTDHLRESETLKPEGETDGDENSEKKDLEKEILDVVEQCDSCQGVVEKMNMLFDKIKSAALKRRADFTSPLSKRMKTVVPIGGVRDYFGLPSIQGENGEEVIYTGQIFDMEQYLKQNGVKRRPVKYHCGLCSKVFSKLKYVKSHYNHQHVNHKKLYCGLCGLSFSYKSNLTRHQKLIHMGDRKEKCHLCDAAFGTRMQLDSHMRKYHDAPKLNCPKCGQTFIQEQSLRNHNEVCPANDTHVKVMCGICMKSFSAKRYLQNHIRAKHTDRVPRKYNCDICGKSFSGQFALKRHRVNKHKNDVKCLALSSDLENDQFEDSTSQMEGVADGEEDEELEGSENAQKGVNKPQDMDDESIEEEEEEEGLSNRFLTPKEKLELKQAMEKSVPAKSAKAKPKRSRSKKSATPKKIEFTEIKQEIITDEYEKAEGIKAPVKLDKEETEGKINGNENKQVVNTDEMMDNSSPANKSKSGKEKSRRKSTKPRPKQKAKIIPEKNEDLGDKSFEILSRNVGADDYDNILINQELGIFGNTDNVRPKGPNTADNIPRADKQSKEDKIEKAKDKVQSLNTASNPDTFEYVSKQEATTVKRPSQTGEGMSIDPKMAEKGAHGMMSLNESIDISTGTNHLVYKDQSQLQSPNAHSMVKMQPGHGLFSMERTPMDMGQFRMESRAQPGSGRVNTENQPSSRGASIGFHVDAVDSINDCSEKGATTSVQQSQFPVDKIGGGLSTGSFRDPRDSGMSQGIQKDLRETNIISPGAQRDQRENPTYPGLPLNLSNYENEMRNNSVGASFPSMLNTNFDPRAYEQMRAGFSSPSPFEGYSNFSSLRPNMMTGSYNNFRPGFSLPSDTGGRLPFDPRTFGNTGMNVPPQSYEQFYGNPNLPSSRTESWPDNQRKNAPE